jgi:hypothetical protein
LRPSSRALQAAVRDLIDTRDGATYFSALLVRPDGFVAWASDTTPSPEEVSRAAARWFASREHHAIGS